MQEVHALSEHLMMFDAAWLRDDSNPVQMVGGRQLQSVLWVRSHSQCWRRSVWLLRISARSHSP